jgi:hypothetical protein
MTSNSSSSAGENKFSSATTSGTFKIETGGKVESKGKDAHLTLAKLQQLSLISASASANGGNSGAGVMIPSEQNGGGGGDQSSTSTIFKSYNQQQPNISNSFMSAKLGATDINRDYTTHSAPSFTLPSIKQALLNKNTNINAPMSKTETNSSNSNLINFPETTTTTPFSIKKQELGLSFLNNHSSKNVALKLSDAKSFLENSGKELQLIDSSPLSSQVTKFSPSNQNHPSNAFLPPSQQQQPSSNSLRMKRDILKPCKQNLFKNSFFASLAQKYKLI